MLSSLLQNRNNVGGPPRIRQSAGSFKNRAVSGGLKIVRPHLLAHCW